MKKFHFPLVRVREWRQSQVTVEESKLERLLAERAGIEGRSAALHREREGEEAAVLTGPLLDGDSLRALEHYRAHNRRWLARLADELRACELRIAAQRTALVEAQRKVRLLEKLEVRRRHAWTVEFEKELEEQAAETHRSRRYNEGREGPG